MNVQNLQAMRGNVAMWYKAKWWILKKLFKNLGITAEGIYRSGQPGFIRRIAMYYIIKPKTRINLAYAPRYSKLSFDPRYDPQDVAEKKFLEKRGVKVLTYTWGAGGPLNWKEVYQVAWALDLEEHPIWIGCEGGRDRTGGAVAYWKRTRGFSWSQIIEDFVKHGIPAEPWLEFVFGERPKN